MTLALQSLVAITLLLSGVVAAVPDLWQRRQPRLQAPPAGPVAVAPPLWIVHSAPGRWFLDGEPMASAPLAARLQRHRSDQPVHLLVSSRLNVADTARALRWLRRLTPAPVLLELPRAQP